MRSTACAPWTAPGSNTPSPTSHVDVSYQHGVTNVVDLVRGGAAAAGVLIRPTSIDEIRRTANEGLLMPPKSTFFTPKLRTGLVRPAAGLSDRSQASVTAGSR